MKELSAVTIPTLFGWNEAAGTRKAKGQAMVLCRVEVVCFFSGPQATLPLKDIPNEYQLPYTDDKIKTAEMGNRAGEEERQLF